MFVHPLRMRITALQLGQVAGMSMPTLLAAAGDKVHLAHRTQRQGIRKLGNGGTGMTSHQEEAHRKDPTMREIGTSGKVDLGVQMVGRIIEVGIMRAL